MSLTHTDSHIIKTNQTHILVQSTKLYISMTFMTQSWTWHGYTRKYLYRSTEYYDPLVSKMLVCNDANWKKSQNLLLLEVEIMTMWLPSSILWNALLKRILPVFKLKPGSHQRFTDTATFFLLFVYVKHFVP